MKGDKLKLLIVDDHEMVRIGLRAYLQTDPDIEIVGEAENGRHAVELAKEHRPDIILMDLVMDEMDGIEATGQIRDFAKSNNLDIKIIVLTSFLEEDMIIPALQAGAFSYLLKSGSSEDILQAVKKAAKGHSVLQGQVSSILVQNAQKSTNTAKHGELTARELEVLSLIGKGKTNLEISQDLFISIKTVKVHVSNVLAKLELDDRTKAAVYALKHGLSD